MTDKSHHHSSSGDDSQASDPRLSDTWVPETNSKPASQSGPKATPQSDASAESQASSDSEATDTSEDALDQTFIGLPPAGSSSAKPSPLEPSPPGPSAMGPGSDDSEFSGDMTFMTPPTFDSPAELPSVIEPPETGSGEDSGANVVEFAAENLQSDGTAMDPSAMDPSATMISGSEEPETTEDVLEVDGDGVEDQFATIVPVGFGEQAFDDDLFSATIVALPPESSAADHIDDNKDDESQAKTRTASKINPPGQSTAVLPPQSGNDQKQPYQTKPGTADRTQKNSPPVPSVAASASPESADMDATFVSDSSDGMERPREQMDDTGQLSDSGSRSGSGTGSGGGRIKSNIWTNAETTSLDELISIRCRPVSGSGRFESSEANEDEVADFEIIEKLAEGGMGVVYVAKQKSLNRELAIKTLKGSSTGTRGTVGKSNSTKAMSRAERQKREMFLSEALVTANLVHPNIIPIHELAETTDGMPYYVMKRVHGIPWNKQIRQMSLTENLDVLHKACDAIAYAHHHGVINRDLKPENIMLGEFGEVLVLDWGLAVPAPHAAEQNFRSPVASFGAGTPAYMSPELWTGPPEAIGECSDIYLLGAILFEIVTGEPPHEFPKVDSKAGRSDLWKTIDCILRVNKIRETNHNGELLEIAYKAMRTNAAERFGSVLEFQFAVRNYQRHEESRRLSQRAAELVDLKADNESLNEYHTYQTASALFEESLRTWSQNSIARNGLRTTRLRYAQLANQKGDYDLGLQVAAREQEDPEFLALKKKLSTAKTIRSGLKWTALAAMLLVVALGAKSIYDNGIITNLNAEVSTRKAEATQAIADADVAKASAVVAKSEADTAREQADVAKNDALKALSEAEEARREAAISNDRALVARLTAEEAEKAALISKNEATTAIAQANDAMMKVAAANVQLAAAEMSVAEAVERQQQAETAARVAQVEIQSQSIRGLTLNENYSDALREINRLLDGELLPQLPEVIRAQRTTELRAQKEQLLRRTRAVEEPIQAQATSPDEKWLALGDADGRVVIVSNPGTEMSWKEEEPRTLVLDKEIASLRFLDASRLLIASGATLHVWDIDKPTAMPLEGHTATVRGLDVEGNLILSGDESGRIIVWDSASYSPVTQIVANTSIRDVAWIPGSRTFIYAGTRGGQSADILAYRIPDEPSAQAPADSDSGTADSGTADTALTSENSAAAMRPRRLGQLRLSRDHNDAPAKLSVSPDGRLLVISNSNNGNLLVLKKNPAATATSGFPFEQPADLERQGDLSWLVTQHDRPVNSLSWSSHSLTLLTASDDRRIGVWTTAPTDPADESVYGADGKSRSSAKLRFQQFLRGHGARVTQASFLNADATRISSSSADGFSRLWDLATLEQDSSDIRRAFHLSQRSDRPSSEELARSLSTNAARRNNNSPRAVASAVGELGWQTTSLQNTDTRSSQSGTSDGTNRDAEAVANDSKDAFAALNRQPVTLNRNNDIHRAPVRAIQFSDDGSQLLSGAADGTMALWSMETLQPVRSGSGAAAAETLKEGHEYNVSRMEQLQRQKSDGHSRLLITSGFDGSLRLWNMDTDSARMGVQQQVIAGLGLVNAFAAAKDGSFLVTSVIESNASQQGECCVWNLDKLLSAAFPKPVRTLRGIHRAEITAIAVSTDSRLIATGGRDGIIAVWDSQAGEVVCSRKAHAKDTSVTTLAWLKDGSLISAGLDGQLIRWELSLTTNAETRAQNQTETNADTVDTTANSPTTGVSLERFQIFDRDKSPIEQVAVSPDEQRLLVISVETNRRQKSTQYHLDVWPITTRDDSIQDYGAAARPKRIGLASLQGRQVQTLSSAQWSMDGKSVLVSTNLGVQLIDATTWKVQRVVSTGTSTATDAQFVSAQNEHDPSHMVTFDGTAASLWDLSTGNRLSHFRGPFPVNTVALMPAMPEPLILAAGVSLRGFSGNTNGETFGRPVFHQQRTHSSGINRIAVAPSIQGVQQHSFLSAGADGRLVLWRWLPDERKVVPIQDVMDLKSAVTAVKWSRDSSLIVAVTLDGIVAFSRGPFGEDGVPPNEPVLFRPADAEEVQLLGVDLSPDGLHVAVVGRIARTSQSIGWILRLSAEPQTPVRIVCTFSGHDAGGIGGVAFAGDSPYLATGGHDGSLILWNWQQTLPGETPIAYEAFRFMNASSTTAHAGPITDVCFNAATSTVASASKDTQIILWSWPF